MDFFEKFLGLSPDGGDGSSEAMYVAAALVLLATMAFRSSIAALIRKIGLY